MTWLGMDIGGANLKAATTTGWTRALPFPLWRKPGELAAALSTLVDGAPSAVGLALTMTGELCDCFRTKEEGVNHILSAVETIAASRGVSVFLVDGRFVDLAAARESFHLAAASNWRALAAFACRYVSSGCGLLVDVGSTTCDIIPIEENRVAASGMNDTERLALHELVYCGVGRTPICAVTGTLPWRGNACPVAAEVFATTADAYVLLGEIDEDCQANWTADGRALDIRSARQRLARQICADSTDLGPDTFERMARAVYDVQLRRLAEGLVAVVGRMTHPPTQVVVSGAGEFLARAATEKVLLGCQITSLAGELGAELSRAAPAFAVAVLGEKAST